MLLAFLAGLAAVALVQFARARAVGSSRDGARAAAGAPPQAAPSHGTAASLDAALREAKQLIASQRLEEAQAALEQARALAPADAEVAFLLGDVAYRKLQMQAAEAHYRRASELDPRSAAALGSLALVLNELGQFEEAAAACRRALALAPDDPRLAALLAQSLLRLGDAKEAAERMERALRAGLRGAERYATLGRARDLLGQPQAALDAFTEALRQDPRSPLVHYWRADALKRLGRAREAAAALEEYRTCQERMQRLFQAELRVAQNPRDVSALLQLARLRVERGYISAGAQAVERASELAPGDPEVRRAKAAVERAAATSRDVES